MAQVTEQMQYMQEKTCQVEKKMSELAVKQIGLDTTERELKEIEKRIQVETTRLGKHKIDLEREAQELKHTYSLRLNSRQELIDSDEAIKAKEIEIFERESQEYELAKKQ